MARKKDGTKSRDKRMLILRNGRQYEILSEDARFYYCEGTQFRKGNPSIVHVDEEVKRDAEC